MKDGAVSGFPLQLLRGLAVVLSLWWEGIHVFILPYTAYPIYIDLGQEECCPAAK